jgi:hypothetical protein
LRLFEDFLFEAVAFGWGVLRTASGLIRNNAVKASSVDSGLRDTGSALFHCFSFASPHVPFRQPEGTPYHTF